MHMHMYRGRLYIHMYICMHMYMYRGNLKRGEHGGRLQNVFSDYRMCSLTTECVLLPEKGEHGGRLQNVFSDYRMCSLTIECVLLPGTL